MRLLRENETSYDVSFYLATRKNARESLILRTFMDELLARIYDAAPLANLRDAD
jgi:hypothetical protein